MGSIPTPRDALVERFGADIDRPIRQLSTGNRQKLGLVQRLEIEFAERVDLDEFRALPAVTEVHADGRTVTVGFAGSADAVVKAAATHKVLALRPREEDLEDIFLRYYRSESAA